MVLETMAIFTSGGLGCSTEAKEAAFYIGICAWAFGNLVGHVPCAAWRSIRDRRLMEIQKHTDLLCWKLGCCQIVRFIRRSYIFTAIFAATNQHSNGITNYSFCGPNGRLNTHFAVIKSMNLDDVPFLASHETVSVWSVGCRAPT